MKKFITFIIVACSLTSVANAQDYQTELLKDIVIIKDGKFTSNDFTLLTLSDGSNFQIKSYAEAPSSGVISRDNFVALFSMMTTEMINNLTEDPFAVTTDLEEIIGYPDIEINCYMTRTGIQFEVKGPDGVNRFTQRWEDLI